MSDAHRDDAAPEEAAIALPPPAAEPPPAEQREEAPAGSPRPRHRATTAAIVVAAVLVLVIAGIATSPFWAPVIAPLLPWGRPLAAIDLAPLRARIAALEQRPAPVPPDLSGIQHSLQTLAARTDRLEHAAPPDHQLAGAVTALQAGQQQLAQRLGALDTQAAAQAREIGDLRQQQARLDTGAAALAGQVSALEQQARARATLDRSASALFVLLLQMREAIDAGRPFAADYEAFGKLAHDQPELLAAAQPLADAAKNGVASRSTLAERLHELAGRIATATAPPPRPDWQSEVLARVRALVTIRHLGSAAKAGPEAAVAGAEAALGRGDLQEAVADLDALSGAAAQAARPWLERAHARLATERALDHVQQMLAARLAAPPPNAASPS